MPSVVMNDGTRMTVEMKPLMNPTVTPITSSTTTTGHMFDGSPSISRAATTTMTVTSEPTERSKLPLISTKYEPAARMTSGAERFR